MTLYTGHIVLIMLFSSLLRSGGLKFAAKFKFIFILNSLPICIYALYILLFLSENKVKLNFIVLCITAIKIIHSFNFKYYHV